jgi:Flp pilus assembly protein TadG
LIGLWELGRMAEVEQILSNAARDAARRASSAQITTAQTNQVVTDYLNNATITTTNVQTTIQNVTAGQSVTYDSSGGVVGGADFNLANATQNDRLTITISIPFNDFRWATISRVFASSSLTGRATWYALKDKDFPSIGDPPIE